MKRLLMISVGIILLLTVASAQSDYARESDSLTIYFKVGRHDYDPSYMDNGKRMNDFIQKLRESNEQNSLVRIVGLNFKASSSPEGRYDYNSGLSQRRANTMEGFLRHNALVADSTMVITNIAEAWDDLAVMVKASDMPWRDEVLKILETYPVLSDDEKGNVVELRKSVLMEFEEGKPWKYMLDNWFPKLRQFTVVIKSGLDLPPIAIVASGGVTPLCEKEASDYIKIDDYQPRPVWTHKMTLKSNVLGWGMGHTNISIEADIAPHFSVSVPFYYSGGFDYFKETLKFRGIVLQPELRWYPWLQEKVRNGGFFVGIHFGLGWYNFALDGDYRIQDCDGKRPSWGGGLGLGYSLQFKKSPRWGMEFAVGGGVYDSKYDMFFNENNGPYYKRGIRKTWFGVDNAAVSFIYKFDMKDKGGRR